MIKIEVDFKVEDFTEDLEKYLEDIKPKAKDMKAMGDILVDELKKNLETSTNLQEGKFMSNTRKWHNRKIKRGGDPRPLIDSAQTLRSIKIKSMSDNEVVVQSIGAANWWHNNRRYPVYGQSRSWFGISQNVVSRIIDYWAKKYV